jgi:RimJ/RimL family protein N-acetyltransferase
MSAAGSPGAGGETVHATARLVLTRFVPDDAPFVLRLVNDPDWIRYIGDRGVRTEDDARGYLERGPIAMYARHSFGLWRVARREDGLPVGMCGLIKRETLPDVDVGFAFLPDYRGMGYAAEAVAATMALAAERYGLRRVVAIASPDNARSLRLLEKLGMSSEGMTPGGDPDDPTLLYARDLAGTDRLA